MEIKVGTQMNPNNSVISIDYLDGYGEIKQSVYHKFSPQKADIINSKERLFIEGEAQITEKHFLPVPIQGNYGNYKHNYDLIKNATSFYKDAKPYVINYSEYVGELPVSKQGSGEAWFKSDKSLKFKYKFSAEKVKQFVINGNNIICTSFYYGDSCLFLSKSIDEDGKSIENYTDIFGKLILTRTGGFHDKIGDHETYYIYDQAGNLRFVIPPILADLLIRNGIYHMNSQNILKYAYSYIYDAYGRCIKKRLPGCDWIEYKYDAADRLIYSQDGEQRIAKTTYQPEAGYTTGKWNCNVYDVFGRIAFTGETERVFLSEDQVPKATYNGIDPTWLRFGGYQIDNIRFYWDVFQLRTANYYDNYDFLNLEGFKNLKYINRSGYDTRYGSDTDKNAAKGLLTGTMTALLNGSNSFLYTVYYYDEKGRVIQTQSTNISGKDIEYIAYNFVGQPTSRLVEHKFNQYIWINDDEFAEQYTEQYNYTYDHAGRLTQVTRNGITIEKNSYDELGRLAGKSQGNHLSSRYGYNIRGWRTATTENYTGFAQTLNYEKPTLGTPSYNGNISQMIYQYKDGTNYSSTFDYDNLNRLTMAYDDKQEEGFSYDKHGNITQVYRTVNGWPSDLLDINYTGNQINNLFNEYADNRGASYTEYPGENSTFTYNKNGSLTSDSGRGITEIKYNSLNLPEIIRFKNGNAIYYLYTADGMKVKARYLTAKQAVAQPLTDEQIKGTVSVSPRLYRTDQTFYSGNLIYKGSQNTPDKLLFEGGYDQFVSHYDIDNGTTSYTVDTHFQLKDYLGNIRDVVDGNGQTVQRTEYHPFGTPLQQKTGDAGAQPYKFGGKEFDQMHGLNWYDFHARMYDPLLGRFHTVDPLAEKYYSHSPYAYVMNNPLRYIDPDGCSTHTDSLGNVVAVYNDGNLGVFKHSISADTYDGSELLAKNGTNMGETEYWDEFLPDFSSKGEGFTIQFGESFDGIISQMHEKARGMDLKEIAANSAGGGLFDIKKDYPGIGRTLNGKYVSSRSAGNYLAGYNASQGTYFGIGISFDTFQKLAGALHIEESAGGRLSNAQKVDIVIFGTYSSSNHGKFKAPTWGEIPYQYRMSKKGWNHGK
ncbi:MAG: RHS repeat-associated core domain-containing protein [Dysgonomonas sp.]